MPASDPIITSTSAYPVYADKATYMGDLEDAMEQHGSDMSRLRWVLYRLSNTDTSNWGDPTVRHDA